MSGQSLGPICSNVTKFGSQTLISSLAQLIDHKVAPEQNVWSRFFAQSIVIACCMLCATDIPLSAATALGHAINHNTTRCWLQQHAIIAYRPFVGKTLISNIDFDVNFDLSEVETDNAYSSEENRFQVSWAYDRSQFCRLAG